MCVYGCVGVYGCVCVCGWVYVSVCVCVCVDVHRFRINDRSMVCLYLFASESYLCSVCVLLGKVEDPLSCMTSGSATNAPIPVRYKSGPPSPHRS